MKLQYGENISDPARLLTGITINQIIDLLDGSYDLVYVERSNLDDHLETLQKCIQKGSREPLWELTDDWFHEDEYGSVNFILNELQETCRRNDMFDPGDEPHLFDNAHDPNQVEEGLEAVFEDYSDWLRDAVYDRDRSDPVSDLIRNTAELTLHYRTGHEVANMFGHVDPSEFWGLKKALGIKRKDITWDKELTMLMSQASYGGQLIIFFMDSFERWADPFPDKINTIKFKDPHICIWDGWNGSGDDVILKGHTMTLPFDRTEIYIDETCHYNYSQAVCGMRTGFCEGTQVSLLSTRRRVKK